MIQQMLSRDVKEAAKNVLIRVSNTIINKKFSSSVHPSHNDTNDNQMLGIFGNQMMQTIVGDSDEQIPLPNYIIHPSSKFRCYWDIFIVLILTYNAVVIPYRVSFDTKPSNFLYYLETIFDVLFWIDIILNFFTAIENKNIIIASHKKIIIDYLKTWFLPDIISTLPYSHMGSFNNSFQPTIAKLPRFLKLFRLLKLFRVMRISNYIRQIEIDHDIHVGVSRIINILSSMLLVTHIIGCLWYLIAVFEGTNVIDYPNEVIGLRADSWVARRGILESSRATRYINSIYWGFTTLATVGFGDISAFTNGEMIFSIIVTIAGVTWYAVIVSSVASVMSSFDTQNKEIRKKHEALNNFCHEANIPIPLRKKLRGYLEFNLLHATKKHSFESDKILSDVSPELRSEVMLYLNRRLIKSIPFLLGKGPLLIAEIVSELRPIFSHANDVIFIEGEKATNIYFMIKGEASILKRNITKDGVNRGSIFGLIGTVVLEVNWCTSIASTSCDMQTLSKESLIKLQNEYAVFSFDLKHLAMTKLNKYSSFKDIAVKNLIETVIKDLHKISLQIKMGTSRRNHLDLKHTNESVNGLNNLQFSKTARQLPNEIYQKIKKIKELVLQEMHETNDTLLFGTNLGDNFTDNTSRYNASRLSSRKLSEQLSNIPLGNNANLFEKLSNIEQTIYYRFDELEIEIKNILKNYIKKLENKNKKNRSLNHKMINKKDCQSIQNSLNNEDHTNNKINIDHDVSNDNVNENNNDSDNDSNSNSNSDSDNDNDKDKDKYKENDNKKTKDNHNDEEEEDDDNEKELEDLKSENKDRFIPNVPTIIKNNRINNKTSTFENIMAKPYHLQPLISPVDKDNTNNRLVTIRKSSLESSNH